MFETFQKIHPLWKLSLELNNFIRRNQKKEKGKECDLKSKPDSTLCKVCIPLLLLWPDIGAILSPCRPDREAERGQESQIERPRVPDLIPQLPLFASGSHSSFNAKNNQTAQNLNHRFFCLTKLDLRKN